MTRNSALIAFAAAGLAAALFASSAQAACPTADRIDGTTAAQATQKLQQAGYGRVHDLKKSCDNFWHGLADRSGKPARIALSPQGKVLVEDDSYTGRGEQSAAVAR
jgi:hypothetical protein